MSKAFIIWTPLHLYNASKYIISHNLIGRCDAYYVCQSFGMEQYIKQAREVGLFRNIFLTTSAIKDKNKKLWEYISVIISPDLYVRHLFGSGSTGNYYDQIFLSVPTRVNDAIIRANRCHEVVGYDDGTGSYITSLYDIDLGKKYNFAKRLRGKKNITVNKVYLACPEFAIVDYFPTEVLPLSCRTFTKQEDEFFQSMWRHSCRTINKYIYLNQPLQDTRNPVVHKHKEMQIVKNIHEAVKDQLVVRLHPREQETDCYNDVLIDDNTSMWEILCEDSIKDDHCLISSFSTAQFTPKLYCNKEPRLVFTYKLYDDYTEDETERFSALIEQLRSIYQNKNQIRVPSNTEELIESIIH